MVRTRLIQKSLPIPNLAATATSDVVQSQSHSLQCEMWIDSPSGGKRVPRINMRTVHQWCRLGASLLCFLLGGGIPAIQRGRRRREGRVMDTDTAFPCSWTVAIVSTSARPSNSPIPPRSHHQVRFFMEQYAYFHRTNEVILTSTFF
jgi:hypothetical protein